jgi:hypothetical protein
VGQVTYARDVAPIVREHCTPCHRPGDVAPFPLLTFEDVRLHAARIADVTRRRVMPPWKPVAGAGGPFIGERRLTADQIATLAQWVAAGMPRGGDEDAAPAAATVAPEAGDLGPPDLVVTMPDPFILDAEGPDVFRTFVVPIPTTAMRYVAAVEFRINGARAIHHANLRLDSTPDSRARDAADPRPGFEGPVGGTARYPDGYFLGWTPGQRPVRAARRMAWRLAPGSDLVIQLHLRRSGQVERVQPSVAFYFTDEAPGALPLAMRLGKQDLDLAPGATLVARDSYTLPVDVDVHAVHPHAHARATDIKAYATLPDGSRQWLIHIDDWDFNWQDVYRYRDPLRLPRGTTIHTEFTYDNSARNPRNPDTPPRRVLFGQNSSDEMGDLWLQVRPGSADERAALYRDFYPKTVAEDVNGYTMLVRANPDHAGYRRDLANGYYNLGTLQMLARRMTEAEASFRAAVAWRPDHAATHNNLGVALKAQGKIDDAIAHFRRAVALDPGNADARANLATAEALKKK